MDVGEVGVMNDRGRKRYENEDAWGVETMCQHLGEDYRYEGAVVAPLFQNSLFVQPDAERFIGRWADRRIYDYTRTNNPTIELAERKIAALEKTEACRLFSSGMGAIAAAIMSCVKNGQHVVCTDAAYGPTKRLLQEFMPRFGVETTFVDGRNLSAIEEAIRPNTALIYMESPGTFYFHVQDIAGVVAIARERNIKTCLDNSTASPIFQNPAEFGVDLVCHSATKYIGGHSDVVAGAVCGSAEALDRMTEVERGLIGANIDPFAAWLLVRSLRTLPLRMERHMKSAMQVASFLESHPAVARVWYPGLASHDGHSLAMKQMRGTSGMLSFEPKFQEREQVFAFCDRLSLFQMGPSWGGHESLAIPLFDTERDSKWFIRISVGLESPDDLVSDLKRSLEAV